MTSLQPRLILVAIVALSGGVSEAVPRDTPSVPLEQTAEASAPRPAPEELPTRSRRNPLREASAASSPPSDPSPGTAAEQGGGDGALQPACRKPGCTSCPPQVPSCRPKWEDKKSKKAQLAITCDFECVRPWEPYHDGACCEEKTTPCGEVRTRKKLYKTEEERVERVLKYEVVMKPVVPCCDPQPPCSCLGCRCLGSTFERFFSWCHR